MLALMCKNIRKRLLVKQEPVNLKYQTIFSIIPYVQLYSFYRIQKLRRYILITIGILFGISLVIVTLTLITLSLEGPEEANSVYVNIIEFWKTTPMTVVLCIIGSSFNIYLVRKWSKKWNKQFEDKQTDSQENVEN